MADLVLTVQNEQIVVQPFGADALVGFVGQVAQLEAKAVAASVTATTQASLATIAAATAAGFVNGILYADVATGLAATAANGYFTVAGNGTTGYATLYRNVASAAQQIATYPAAGILELTPEMVGAIGDGVTYDQPAFDRLNAAIAASPRVKVTLRRGAVYIGGRQVPGGSQGYLMPTAMLSITNIEQVILDYNGGCLRFQPGMKFGSFDPATGNAISPTLPFYDYSKRADIGHLVYIRGVKRVTTMGAGELDCNGQNMVRGGGWGDTGYQLSHYGQLIGEYEQLTDHASVYAHDSLLDLFSYWWTGLTEAMGPKPASIRNKTARYAGRLPCSIVGSNGLSIDDSTFAMPGYGRNSAGIVTSPPGCCIDIEAEGAVNRHIHIRRNVALIEGPYGGAAFVADSGDSSDIVCEARIYGRVATSKPRVAFRNGELHGAFTKIVGGSAVRQDNTVIENMVIDDVTQFGSVIPNAGTTTGGGALLMDCSAAGAGVLLRDNQIRTVGTRLRLDGATTRRNTLTVANTTASVNDMDFVAIWSADSEDDLVIDGVPISGAGSPANGFAILFVANPRARNTRLIFAAGKVKWGSWSEGAGGFPTASRPNGLLTQAPTRVESLALGRSMGFGGGGYYGARTVYSSPTMPTSGSFAQDDLVLAEAQAIANGRILFGWLRLTTGSNNVAGTDWQPLYLQTA